jgi:hypothetical protein
MVDSSNDTSFFFWGGGNFFAVGVFVPVPLPFEEIRLSGVDPAIDLFNFVIVGRGFLSRFSWGGEPATT